MATNNADFLTTLAAVCDTAERLELPRMHTMAAESFQTVTTSGLQTQTVYTTAALPQSSLHEILPPYGINGNCQYTDGPPLEQSVTPLPQTLSLPQPSEVAVLAAQYPTPPPTPDGSHGIYTYSPTITPQIHLVSHINPLMKSTVTCMKFQDYLDETWPEDPQRRGSAVVRASVYANIANVLHGQFKGTTRFKNWVKKSQFFLVEKLQPGVGYGACLAVPVIKSRGALKDKSGRKTLAQASQHSYRLVARVEDFMYIIGNYHNCQKGHHGIRRTYAMIKEDFSYVPRAAVAKFVELCDVCSSKKDKRKTKQQTGGNPGSKVFEENKNLVAADTGLASEIVSDCVANVSETETDSVCHPTTCSKENSFLE